MEGPGPRINREMPGALEKKTPVRLDLPIRNSNRTVGTMLSYEVARRYGEEGCLRAPIQMSFKGSAGQSFAAFLAKGITMYVEGDANDYFCKGLSGGHAIITPPAESTFCAEQNVLVGNVVLLWRHRREGVHQGRGWGAIRRAQQRRRDSCGGRWRPRLRVHDPGAGGGPGAHGTQLCRGHERRGRPTYSTSLESLGSLCNVGMVSLEDVVEEEDIAALRRLIEEHLRYTSSTQRRENPGRLGRDPAKSSSK